MLLLLKAVWMRERGQLLQKAALEEKALGFGNSQDARRVECVEVHADEKADAPSL